MKSVCIAGFAVAAAMMAQEQPKEIQPKQIFQYRSIQGPAGAIGNVQFIAATPIGGKVVTGAPFSAEAVTETTQTLVDGNRIVQKTTSKIYRDSQGRERREESLPGLPEGAIKIPPMIFISDPVAGVTYSLNERAHTAQKMVRPMMKFQTGLAGGSIGLVTAGAGGAVTAGAGRVVIADDPGGLRIQSRMILPGQPAGEGSKEQQLGSDTIEGVTATGTRRTVTIPAGAIGNEQPIQVVDETWYSPELQVNVMTKHTDPRMGETVYRLTNINRAEPDPALFQVPGDYTIQDAPTPRIVTVHGEVQQK
jgi:hypothetical protein